MKRLLQAGASYDHCGSEGSTALMTAAETLNEDVVGPTCCDAHKFSGGLDVTMLSILFIEDGYEMVLWFCLHKQSFEYV